MKGTRKTISYKFRTEIRKWDGAYMKTGNFNPGRHEVSEEM